MKTVKEFVDEVIESGSKIVTDCFQIYNSLTENGYEHEKYLSRTPEGDQVLDWTHTVI
jgi:antitoxin component HigA of HigAB toxin-antitoxin module